MGHDKEWTEGVLYLNYTIYANATTHHKDWTEVVFAFQLQGFELGVLLWLEETIKFVDFTKDFMRWGIIQHMSVL